MSSYNRPMANSSGNYRKLTFDLFVANLPLTITDDVLTDSFVKFGPIASVQIRDGNKPGMKIAFVRFLSQQSVDLASADTVCINANRIFCRPANRKIEKPQSGSGSNSDAGSGGDHNYQRNQVAAGSGNKPDIVSFSHSDGPPGLVQNDDPSYLPSQRNERVQLFMTHVESPCVFWAQQPKLAEVIANVERSLSSVCPTAHTIERKPEPAKVYGTKFSLDEQWYRCEVNRYVSDSQSEVTYVDYGNKEVVKNNEIVELPECLMQLSPLASKYCLYGIKAVDNPALFAKGIEKLSMLKEASVLDAILYEPFNGLTPVKLKTCDGFDVIKEMLSSKTCVPVTDLDACQINLKELTPQVSSVLSHPPLVPRLVEPKVRTTDGSGDHVFSASTEKLAKELKQLQQEKASLENWVQGLQREADVKHREFETHLELLQKQKMECEQELQTLRNQKLVLEDELSLVVNNTLSKKMARVFTGLRNVMLQREQLQSAAGAADPLAEAITLATSCTVQTSLDMVPVLGQIDDVRARYVALQAKLMTASEDAQCQDSVTLDQVISKRNDARNELFTLLQEFIDLLSDVDALTSHELKIEKLLETLEVKYASYLAPPVVTDADLDRSSEAYLAWKNEKQLKSEETRKMTDLMGSLVLKSLEKLKEELLRRSSTVDLTEASIPDLDCIFEDYEAAINTEMKVASQEESASDIKIIQKTLISLTSELRRRLENVRKLIRLRAQFVDECEELNQWLNKSPDISELQLTSKTIKALKSKLRHRLADLQDMQEDGREKSEEFVSVENDLTEIRGQLQQQLETEDGQMKWLSVLTLNHFPEMIVKHPELNLQKFIEFNGLLKSGHMLDQFQLNPLHGQTENDVHKSTYCGKPVILKEFLVGMQSKASQSDFLKNVKEYSEIMSPHLAQLMAVFFGMNDRQAVVVLPWYEFSLTQLMEDNASGLLPEKAKVLGCVLRGINGLHSVGVVHGAIHPNNILVNASSGDVVVANYDFTKTPMQRSENPFITSSGLKFQAPELQLGLASCQPSFSFPADMYNFGLLILWVHDPQIASVPSSLPDLSCTSLDSDTATLVAFLLDYQPDRRPGTDKILEVGYFSPDELEEESPATELKDEAACPSSNTDGMGASVDVPDVKTEAQLDEVTAKDVTEDGVIAKDVIVEGETGKSSPDKQRLPESEEEPEKQSEEKDSIIECDPKQAVSSAGDTCKMEDELGNSCKDV